MEKTAQQCARMMTIASKATASDGRAFLVSNHPQISYMVFRVRAYLALGMLNVYDYRCTPIICKRCDPQRHCIHFSKEDPVIFGPSHQALLLSNVKRQSYIALERLISILPTEEWFEMPEKWYTE